jgi:hypothetical protein
LRASSKKCEAHFPENLARRPHSAKSAIGPEAAAQSNPPTISQIYVSGHSDDCFWLLVMLLNYRAGYRMTKPIEASLDLNVRKAIWSNYYSKNDRGDEMASLITKFLAAFLILLSLVKLTMLLVNARAWISLVKRLYADTKVTSTVALVAAGTVLYLLIRAGLDIVQILAVCLFVFLLILVGVAPYVPRLYDWVESQDMRQVLIEQWLYVTFWIVLLLWGAYALLFSV